MIIRAAIKKGNALYTGKRHCYIFQENYGINLKNCEQGFIDEKGKFFNRKDAYKEALKNKQIKENERKYLISEDLY
jgi:hypothetical protein